MSFGDLIWLFFIFSAIQPMLQQKMLEAMRVRKISQLERERKSRVILLVHRQETMRFLGFPIARYIDINDSEEVLRAIQMTDDEVPLDMVLHTPGGLALAALQIAQAVRDHKSKVTVFVPHYAMSGGTLVALAADEIVMCKHSVLGAIDPQLGDSPAASLLKVVRTEARGGNRRSDLDPRGHRAEGDRSGQAGGSRAVAAHAPNRSGGSWRKSSQPGHGHTIIRFGPQRRRSSVCQFAPTCRTKSSNSCRSTRNPCARKAAAGLSTCRRADKRKPERNALGGCHDSVGRRKNGRR